MERIRSVLAGVVAIMALFMGSSPQAARAAEFVLGETGDRCTVHIQGEILQGDYQRLISKLAPWEAERSQREYQYDAPNDIACLDSPGGNVFEGLKIAEYIYDQGLGTYVGPVQKCFSICAIMFMMGRLDRDEAHRLDRTLHATGLLGFHRPYLTLENAQTYSSTDINSAFDFGIEGVFRLMVLASHSVPRGAGQMIQPDLMRVMLETPPEGMHVIRTVEEAIRWEIEIEGVPNVVRPAPLNLFYACENALSKPVSRPSEAYGGDELQYGSGRLFAPTVFSLRPMSWHDAYRALSDQSTTTLVGPPGAFPVESLRSGYMIARCWVKPTERGVEICGFEDNRNVRLGQCDGTLVMEALDELALYHPQMDLMALHFDVVDATDVARLAQCKISAPDGSLTNDDTCLQVVTIFPRTGEQWVRHRLVWPSGASTVVEIRASQHELPDIAAINGQPAEFVGRDGACVRNTETGNTLCVSG